MIDDSWNSSRSLVVRAVEIEEQNGFSLLLFSFFSLKMRIVSANKCDGDFLEGDQNK